MNSQESSQVVVGMRAPRHPNPFSAQVLRLIDPAGSSCDDLRNLTGADHAQDSKILVLECLKHEDVLGSRCKINAPFQERCGRIRAALK